jgi:hypothetical protein
VTRDAELDLATLDLLTEHELASVGFGGEATTLCEPRSQPEPAGGKACEGGTSGNEDRHEGDGP